AQHPNCTLMIKALLSGCGKWVSDYPYEDLCRTLIHDLRQTFDTAQFPVWYEELKLEGLKASDLFAGGKDDFASAVFAQSECMAEDWQNITSLASIEKQALTAAMKAILGDAFPRDPDMENAHALLAEAEVRALLGLRTGS
ncbi:MAG: hypothetical protein ABIK28_24570, partial [Planctomycetota bacterium]